MTGILVDGNPFPRVAQVNVNVPVELVNNITSFLTFAGIATNPDSEDPASANLVLTGTPPGVEVTGSLSLAFDFVNLLTGTAVLCGDLDSITSRVDEEVVDVEPEGGLGNLGLVLLSLNAYSGGGHGHYGCVNDPSDICCPLVSCFLE